MRDFKVEELLRIIYTRAKLLNHHANSSVIWTTPRSPRAYVCMANQKSAVLIIIIARGFIGGVNHMHIYTYFLYTEARQNYYFLEVSNENLMSFSSCCEDYIITYYF